MSRENKLQTEGIKYGRKGVKQKNVEKDRVEKGNRVEV